MACSSNRVLAPAPLNARNTDWAWANSTMRWLASANCPWKARSLRRPRRALSHKAAVKTTSPSSAIRPIGQFSSQSATTITNGVTAPVITGVNTCAGNWARAIMPWVITWPSWRVFCAVNQPRGKPATWSPTRWRAPCKMTTPTATPALSTRRRPAQQASMPVSISASQSAAPRISPVSRHPSTGTRVVRVKPLSKP